MTAVVSPHAFAPEALEARAAAILTLVAPDGAIRPDSRGDHDLIPDMRPGPDQYLRRAAVLIPVLARPGEASVLLTRRASHLRDHSGQVAFPGGKMDPGEDPLAAALREAREEIGLASTAVRPLGYLDPYLSGTGFHITPVLAIVDPGAPLIVNSDEVEIVFEVPLAFLMSPGNHETHSGEWKGKVRHYYAMPFGDHYIWGATAGILRNMYERLYAP